MILEGIDVFVEVVDAQSFSGAAKRLGMPTTTVSAKIARLEKRLGATLLHRTTRKLSVTDLGQQYYEHCTRALQEMIAADRALSQSLEEPTGRLRVTATVELAQYLLAPAIQRYLNRYAQVSVEVNVSNDIQDLIRDKIDLAVRVGTLVDSSLIARKFMTLRVGLWASETYLRQHGAPRSLADLKSHKLIGFTNRTDGVPMVDGAGQTHNVSFAGQVQVDDMQTCKALIESGLGIGPLPDFGNIFGQNHGGLRPVLANFTTDELPVYFVYPRQRFVPPKVRKFIDTALEMF